MRLITLAAIFAACSFSAFAQPAPSPGAQGTVATLPPSTTYGGSMTVAAATSTTLSSGNATMQGASAIGGNFGKLFVLNTGANLVYVCWFGGTASTAAGCEPLAAGASDTKNLNNSSAVPTFYSTSGTTLWFSN